MTVGGFRPRGGAALKPGRGRPNQTHMDPIPLVATLKTRLERRELALPLLSDAVARLLAEGEAAESSDVGRIVTIVRRDPALAGHLLDAANSALFSGRDRVGSLQQAVCRLGARGLRRLALVVAARTRAFQARRYEAEVRAQFAHCLLTALHAQEVARLRRLSVDDAFLAGLLHDVGKALLLQAIGDLEDQGARPERAEVDGCVAELHAHAGAVLAQAWGLPERIVHAIEKHHAFYAAVPGAREVALLAFADALAHTPIADAERETNLRNHPARRPLGLYPDDVEKLLAGREHVVAQAEAMAS